MHFSNLSRALVLASALSCWFATSPANSSSVIIVGDGDNLGLAIFNAQHGDIIEIRSNQDFGGPVGWRDKFLTIRAGEGFAPTVHSIQRLVGNSQTGGQFRGLNIPGFVIISAGGTQSTQLEFYDNVIGGDITFSGVGDFAIDARFHNNTLQNIFLHGTGRLAGDMLLEGNQVRGNLLTSPIADAHYNLQLRDNIVDGVVSSSGGVSSVIEDNLLRGGLFAGTTFDETADVTLHRNVIHDTLTVGIGSFSSTTIDAANNIIVTTEESNGDHGIHLRSISGVISSTNNIAFVNNTVVGFDQGITLEGIDRNVTSHDLDLSFANMLLDNATDIAGLLPQEIRSSLISDGTFTGTNGNFAGVPRLGPNYGLLAGSIGIDAGNNALAQHLRTDALGNPRVLDGNGDGRAIVDVGAVEFIIPEPGSLLITLTALVAIASPRRRLDPRPRHGLNTLGDNRPTAR